MYLCKDCDHIDVCKYTDKGDGRCQCPKHFRDKHQLQVIVNVSPNTMKALESMGRAIHGG